MTAFNCGPHDGAKRDPALVLACLATPVMVLDTQGTVLTVNEACARLTGLPSERLVGQAAWEALAVGDAVERARDDVRGALARDESHWGWTCHGPAQPPQAVGWTAKTVRDERGAPVALVCCAAPPSARVDAERDLRQTEEEHRIVLSNISDAVFITDDDGAFTFICPNVDVIFGMSFEEVRAAGNIAALLGEDWFDPAVLGDCGEIQNIEREITDKAGRVHTVLVNVKRVSIRRGTRLFTCRDITERKRVEESLKDYQAELAHATRLSTIGEMSSGLAHELSQPLAAISNFSQALIRRMSSDFGIGADLLPHLEQISAQAHRAGEIVRRMRYFVRKQAPLRSAVSVRDLVVESLELLAPTLRKRDVRLNVDVSADLPQVWADAIGVEQVLINLVQNASEVVAESGARHETRDPITIRARQCEPDTVTVSVVDAGPGVDESRLTDLFEPFFTTKRQGMGLGLSISKSIVEANGGCLWATPNSDRGMTFRFTLPVVTDTNASRP